jgi:heme-degrading monooxygenase HmoA
MVVEQFTCRVRPGREAEFGAYEAEWTRALRGARGFITRTLMRNAEDPLEIHVFVRWVGRAYRDQFEEGGDALRRRAAGVLDGAPSRRLLETP